MRKFRRPNSSVHLKNLSVLKLKTIIFFSFALNSIFLLLSTSKITLKFSRSLSDSVENRKQRYLRLFIYFYSSNVALVHRDCPLISSQLFIFVKSIIPSSPDILLLIKHFLTSFSSRHVKKIVLYHVLQMQEIKLLVGLIYKQHFCIFFNYLALCHL